MNNKSKQKNTSAPLLGGQRTKSRPRFRGTGNRGLFRVQASIPTTTLVTGGAGTGSGLFYLNPGLFPTYIKNIALSYQLFRLARLNIEYVPIVGATTNGALRLAYLDNPETIYQLSAGTYSATDINNLVFSATTSKTTSIWNGMTFPAPANRLNRRRWYSVDSSNMANPEAADRTAPAVALVTFEGPNSTNVGYFMLHFTFELKDLAAATSIPLLHLTDPEEIFQGPGGSWWKRVTGGLVQVDPPNTSSISC